MLSDEVKAVECCRIHQRVTRSAGRTERYAPRRSRSGPQRRPPAVVLPKTGSDGGGLDIAARLGHTIVPTTPALVPLVDDDEPWHRTLTGVSQETELALWTGGSIARRLRGSLLWTHFGSSGPVVLDMSRHWLRAQLAGQDPRITLNLLPGRPFESLEEEWRDRTASRPRTVSRFLARRPPSRQGLLRLPTAAIGPSRRRITIRDGGL